MARHGYTLDPNAARLRAAAHFIEIEFDVALAPDAAESWTSIADAILATERAIAADQARGAA